MINKRPASSHHSTRVKICGLTNIEDALFALDAGADYLGFVFYSKSKRAVDDWQVRQITSVLRERDHCPLLVGVFVDEPVEIISEVMESCDLDLAQLNGDEPPSLIADPTSPIFSRSYKAIKPNSLPVAQAEAEWYAQSKIPQKAPSLLIDAYHPTLPGGTGRTADWDIAARLSAEIPRLMLAGGLNPENVEAAIDQVQPFAVDVAGGVEKFPGKKDHGLIESFIEKAKAQA